MWLWITSYYQKWIDNPNYRHRYQFVLIIIAGYVVWVVSAIVLSASNTQQQQHAQQQSTTVITTKQPRVTIVDRNQTILADNILISKVVLDPPQNLQTAGFDSINSIWRVKKYCSTAQYVSNSCWRFLAQQAKQNYDNNRMQNQYVQLVQLEKLVANILGLGSATFTHTIRNIKHQCQDASQICTKYRVIAKNLRFTSTTIQNLIALQQENFLVCRDKTPELGRLQKFAQKYLDWMVTIQPPQPYVKCLVERIGGVNIRNTLKRFYPHSPSTTPLLGGVNSKGKGVFGVERVFDNFLKETRQQHTTIKQSASWKNPYINAIQDAKNTPLSLTIDAHIQFELFNALKQSVEKHNAESGAGIIINPDGEILAMASYPTSDVNKGIDGSNNYSHFINRVLSDTLDTASTIKPLTALIGLETGVLTQDSLLDITEGEGIKQFKPDANRAYISIADIIKESHGLGAIKIGKHITDNAFYEYLLQLGFGNTLGILPAIENAGVLRNVYHWSPIDKKRLSFGGYGVINTTLAHIARSYLVFVNAGIIKNLKLFKNTPHEESQVFSKEYIDYVVDAMQKAVNDNGTGKRAKLEGKIAAGKTGTAQLLIDGVYSNSKHNTLFAGFAPVENPQYVMVVNVKNPDGWYLDGGSVAAPIFKQVMDKILP
jgi:cell division protein FtsI (penicillin-binding protein 3)